VAAEGTVPWPSDHTRIVGIINVTPDSFSGDGVYRRPEDALEVARRFAAEGADILDIGGESTRPGHSPVSLEEELERVVPVVELLAQHLDLPLSVDTTKPEVARRALQAGASIVNDVSGLDDPAMIEVVAESQAGVIIVDGHRIRSGSDIIADVGASLKQRVDRAVQGGIRQSLIAIDPGLGFGKGWRENFEILRRLHELKSLQLPILIGASRKGMIGRVLGVAPEDRLEGSLALATISIANGADMIRAHDVGPTVRVARMIEAVIRYPEHM
jgi:dihydropteroate synthase